MYLEEPTKRDDSPKGMTDSAVRLFADPDAVATALLICFIDGYGAEAVSWDPESILLALDEDAPGHPVENYHKLMAAIALASTDRLARDLRGFCIIADGLLGLGPSDHFEPPSVDAVNWALTESVLLNGVSPDGPKEFHPDIHVYARKILREEGFLRPPSAIRWLLTGDPVKDPLANIPKERRDDVINATIARTHEAEGVAHDRMGLLHAQIKSLTLNNGNIANAVKALAA